MLFHTKDSKFKSRMKEILASKHGKSIAKSLCQMICFGLLLAGCGDPKIPERQLHFYLILSPVDEEQAELSRLFLINAEKNRNNKTKIILPNNFYTVVELCNDPEDEPSFLTPGTFINKSSAALDSKAVTQAAKDSILSILEKGKECTVTPKAFLKVFRNINEALINAENNNREVVLIMQVPWKDQEFKELLPDLKKEMENLSKSNNLEKVMLFGVSPDGTDKLMMALDSINSEEEKFLSPANGIDQTLSLLNHMQQGLSEPLNNN